MNIIIILCIYLDYSSPRQLCRFGFGFSFLSLILQIPNPTANFLAFPPETYALSVEKQLGLGKFFVNREIKKAENP